MEYYLTSLSWKILDRVRCVAESLFSFPSSLTCHVGGVLTQSFRPSLGLFVSDTDSIFEMVTGVLCALRDLFCISYRTDQLVTWAKKKKIKKDECSTPTTYLPSQCPLGLRRRFFYSPYQQHLSLPPLHPFFPDKPWRKMVWSKRWLRREMPQEL